MHCFAWFAHTDKNLGRRKRLADGSFLVAWGTPRLLLFAPLSNPVCVLPPHVQQNDWNHELQVDDVGQGDGEGGSKGTVPSTSAADKTLSSSVAVTMQRDFNTTCEDVKVRVLRGWGLGALQSVMSLP